MNIVEIADRLGEAVDRDSRSWEEADRAIDEFAQLLCKMSPIGGYSRLLPRGYTFKHWISGDYRLEKIEGLQLVVSLGRGFKDLSDVKIFCKDVNSGFVFELEEQLDKESNTLEFSVRNLGEMRRRRIA